MSASKPGPLLRKRPPPAWAAGAADLQATGAVCQNCAQPVGKPSSPNRRCLALHCATWGSQARFAGQDAGVTTLALCIQAEMPMASKHVLASRRVPALDSVAIASHVETVAIAWLAIAWRLGVLPHPLNRSATTTVPLEPCCQQVPSARAAKNQPRNDRPLAGGDTLTNRDCSKFDRDGCQAGQAGCQDHPATLIDKDADAWNKPACHCTTHQRSLSVRDSTSRWPSAPRCVVHCIGQ